MSPSIALFLSDAVARDPAGQTSQGQPLPCSEGLELGGFWIKILSDRVVRVAR